MYCSFCVEFILSNGKAVYIYCASKTGSAGAMSAARKLLPVGEKSAECADCMVTADGVDWFEPYSS